MLRGLGESCVSSSERKAGCGQAAGGPRRVFFGCASFVVPTTPGPVSAEVSSRSYGTVLWSPDPVIVVVLTGSTGHNGSQSHGVARGNPVS